MASKTGAGELQSMHGGTNFLPAYGRKDASITKALEVGELSHRLPGGPPKAASAKYYVNDVINYSGVDFLPMGTRGTKGARKQHQKIPAYIPPADTTLLRISVAGGVLATGGQIFQAVQERMCESNNIPGTVTVEGQSLEVRFTPAIGDEVLFGPHPMDTRVVGHRMFGTLFVAPVPHEAPDSTH